MANRPAYIFEKSATADDVKASLKANGVCMIRGYLTDDNVVKLKEAIKTLAYREHKNQLVEAQSHLGRYTVDEVNELGLPEVAEVLDDSLLKGIAEDFFKPYSPDYHKIYCHHDAENMDFNNAWHFDRGLTLKFFFYLNDVTADNGAFCYDLGSHRANSTKTALVVGDRLAHAELRSRGRGSAAGVDGRPRWDTHLFRCSRIPSGRPNKRRR